MRIIRDFESCPPAYQGAVVALGNFDGVHRGHQAILAACIAEAERLRCAPAVMTFAPHPREFFAKDKAPLHICSLSRKLELLSQAGIETVFLARFNRTLAATTAREFVERLLHRELKVRHVVTGYNFAFGKGREGNTDFLERCASELGFGFTHIEPVSDADGTLISSSRIRAFLKEGQVEKAARLLGRPYAIRGRVLKGDGRGHALGFPTANLATRGLFLPRFGIYAARFRVAGESAWHNAAASLGLRPMFAVKAPLLEAHGLDMNRDVYGRIMEVELVKFLREEKQFKNVEALKEQMETDCRQARSVLERKEAAYG